MNNDGYINSCELAKVAKTLQIQSKVHVLLFEVGKNVRLADSLNDALLLDGSRGFVFQWNSGGRLSNTDVMLAG